MSQEIELIKQFREDTKQHFDLVRKDVSSLRTEHREVLKKIETLFRFKWQIIGGAGVLGAVAGVVVQFLLRKG